MLCVQELTEKKSLLSECEMKCKNLQQTLSHTQALIKVLLVVAVVVVVAASGVVVARLGTTGRCGNGIVVVVAGSDSCSSG